MFFLRSSIEPHTARTEPKMRPCYVYGLPRCSCTALGVKRGGHYFLPHRCSWRQRCSRLARPNDVLGAVSEVAASCSDEAPGSQAAVAAISSIDMSGGETEAATISSSAERGTARAPSYATKTCGTFRYSRYALTTTWLSAIVALTAIAIKD